ncbi:hypothetical protein LINPERPRIM_LOCUS4703 [Linum perenne]
MSTLTTPRRPKIDPSCSPIPSPIFILFLIVSSPIFSTDPPNRRHLSLFLN